MAQPRLPKSLKVERRGAVAILTLARPEKRNALNDATVLGLEAFFTTLPTGVKAVVLAAQGSHFSAGLDLSELKILSTEEGIEHSRVWHRVFDKIEFGRVPVVTVMHGAVVGGGLELAGRDARPRRRALGLLRAARRFARNFRGRRRLGAAAAPDRRDAHDGPDAHRPHLRRRRGASARAARIISPSRARGWRRASRLRSVSPPIRRPPNFAIMQALPRIAEQDRASGYLMESMMAAIAQGNDEAKKRITAFLEKRAAKVTRK
jgi:hypothetical protein